MLSIEELRPVAAAMTAERFRDQLGPFALVLQPPPDEARRMGLRFAGQVTDASNAQDISLGALGLLFQFDQLQIATLPPLKGDERFLVGRGPDCDLVVDHGSVSKHHALLRWIHAETACELQDLGSTNGTFLNGTSVGQRQVRLVDGDILSFGEAQFWYLRSETLHARLVTKGPTGLRGRSG